MTPHRLRPGTSPAPSSPFELAMSPVIRPVSPLSSRPEPPTAAGAHSGSGGGGKGGEKGSVTQSRGGEASAIPIRIKGGKEGNGGEAGEDGNAGSPAPTSDDSSPGLSLAYLDDESDPDDDFKHPKLRLEIRDLTHDGAALFLSNVHPTHCTTTALRRVLRLLYLRPSDPRSTTPPPPTRSVTLVLRDMPGVAYTTGSELDSDHKEIHLSLGYLARARPRDRLPDEIAGVITHELVHCLQYNGKGSCPGGLIEGVADWVRLRCGLSPPHWRKEPDGPWDRGYQHTAYFLDYLDGRFGEGSVRRLNDKLRTGRYHKNTFWQELFGRDVGRLWSDYEEKLKDDEAVVVNKEDISGDEGARAAKKTVL